MFLSPWPWVLKLDMGFAISQPKWSDCHEMKSKHVDWTQGLNDRRVWPWPWPWKMYRIITGVTSDVGVPSTRLLLKVDFSNWIHEFISWTFLVKLICGEYQRTPLMISQHWFRCLTPPSYFLNQYCPNSYGHMVSLGHNALILGAFSSLKTSECAFIRRKSWSFIDSVH